MYTQGKTRRKITPISIHGWTPADHSLSLNMISLNIYCIRLYVCHMRTGSIEVLDRFRKHEIILGIPFATVTLSFSPWMILDGSRSGRRVFHDITWHPFMITLSFWFTVQ